MKRIQVWRKYVGLIVFGCFCLVVFTASCDSPKEESNTFDSSSNSFSSDVGNSSSYSNEKQTNSAQISAPQIEKEIVGKITEIEHDLGMQILTGQARGDWTFQKEEPRNIQILETDYSGKNASIIINIETCDFILQTSYTGKLRLAYEFIAGEWILKEVENINFKRNSERDGQCKEYFKEKKTKEATPTPTPNKPTSLPTFTPNATPTPRPTTTPTPDSRIYLRVTTENLNLRSEPNLDNEPILEIEIGNRLYLLSPTDCRTCAKDGKWFRVRHLNTGKEGWISNEFRDEKTFEFEY